MSMVRMYKENEILECKISGLLLQVTFAAVPIQPLTCSGEVMTLIKKSKSPIEDGEFDLTPRVPLPNAKEMIYRQGEKYTCSICGIEVLVLREAQPTEMLDCCGEGMELMI